MNDDQCDVRRHARLPEEAPEKHSERDALGQFAPSLQPAFQRMSKELAALTGNPMHELCECGRRRGMHRWGDEACPNPAWRPGNGSAQFIARAFTQP